MLHNDIEPLIMKVDEAYLTHAEEVFGRITEELLSLQNQLSKSFSYIKEVKLMNEPDESTSTITRDSFSTTNTQVSSGSNQSWAHYVTTVGKNMKKYAEVGMSRLAAAVPSKLTLEELNEYTLLVCELCDRVQIIASWYRFANGALKRMTALQNTVLTEEMDDSSRDIVHQFHREVPTPEVYGKLEVGV
jgi:hypothetical protein